MLPPVLEIYVVWHPGDHAGAGAAEQFVQHFHGTLFSGLVGGAVEVYVRSEGWGSPEDAPRPIPTPNAPPPNGLAQARITAIVPVLGSELAAAVQPGNGSWHSYVSQIVAARNASADRVGVYPVLVHPHAINGTVLGNLLGQYQRIGEVAPGAPPESEQGRRCRDLAQGIAQLANPGAGRLKVFISHTKHSAQHEQGNVQDLIARVRTIIGQTRLNDFFDANDLQPGCDWDNELRSNAATGALLALRTDLYASREWCQREMLIAKRLGLPIVILDALGAGEERGSFLMDHVPRVPVRHDGNHWHDDDIRLGLNLLVDECLKRALWRSQEILAQAVPGLGISWWAPHAPEPITLAQWLDIEQVAGRLDKNTSIRILHPDPPLGPDERKALDQIAILIGLKGGIDMMTPRLLASRGG